MFLPSTWASLPTFPPHLGVCSPRLLPSDRPRAPVARSGAFVLPIRALSSFCRSLAQPGTAPAPRAAPGGCATLPTAPSCCCSPSVSDRLHPRACTSVSSLRSHLSARSLLSMTSPCESRQGGEESKADRGGPGRAFLGANSFNRRRESWRK